MYTQSSQLENEIQKPFYSISSNKKKNLQINFAKNEQYIYTANYKILLREIKSLNQ